MREMTLAELAARDGQAAVAAALGCTQGAVCQAIKSGRDVRVRLRRGVPVEAYEVRPFPAK